MPLGHIKFRLTVITSGDDAGRREPEAQGLSARPYQAVFISYASQDRPEVIKRVQMLARLRIPDFHDLLTLEPGIQWEKEVYEYIDKCDLFLLFWSTAAKGSEWVLKEVRYALHRKGKSEENPPEIVPVLIEGPPPVPPPPDLAHLHFDDYLTYFMRN